MAATLSDRLSARLPSPTLETIAVLLGVYTVQTLVAGVGVGLEAFALRVPVTARPWTLVTTVYAHASPLHLVTNVVVLAVIGLLVEPRISRIGFHGLFLSAGVLAAGSVVIVGAAGGVVVGAVGASGAVFALVGYGVTAPAAVRGRRRPERVYAGGYADREAAATGLAGVGSRSQPRGGGPPRLLLFVFGVLLVAGPLVAGIAPLELVGHGVGFTVGLATGVATWTVKTEV